MKVGHEGPWPIYLIVSVAIAGVLFYLWRQGWFDPPIRKEDPVEATADAKKGTVGDSKPPPKRRRAPKARRAPNTPAAPVAKAEPDVPASPP